jgi:hypothetical protein
MKVPSCNSAIAWRSCPWVFMTMGPCQGNRLLNRSSRDEQKPNSLRPCLHSNLIAPVEEHQRVIPNVVHRRCIGFRGLLGENGTGIRRVAEGAGAGEDVGKCVASYLHFESLPLAGRHRDIEVIWIRGHAFHRPRLAPELATDDAHPGTVVICHVRDGA